MFVSEIAGNLSSKKKKMLERILKLSTDSSAVALSEMTDKAMFLDSPKLEVVTLDSLIDLAGGAENDAVSVCLFFSGEISGSMLLIFPGGSAFQLISLVMQDGEPEPDSLDEMGVSVLGEVGNLVSAYFLSTLSDHTGLNLAPSPPMVAQDMVGAVLSSAMLILERAPDEVLYIETQISDEHSKIDGHL